MNDCVHFVMLTRADPTPPPDRRRWWVQVGDRLRLADDVALHVLRQRQWRQDSYVLQVELHSPFGVRVHLLRGGEGLDLTGLAGALLVPRALRLGDGRPQAVLMEVVRTDPMAHWVQDVH